jgi:hypothetical protein
MTTQLGSPGGYEPLRIRATREAMVEVGMPVADGILFVTFTVQNAALVATQLLAAIQDARQIIESN